MSDADMDQFTSSFLTPPTSVSKSSSSSSTGESGLGSDGLDEEDEEGEEGTVMKGPGGRRQPLGAASEAAMIGDEKGGSLAPVPTWSSSSWEVTPRLTLTLSQPAGMPPDATFLPVFRDEMTLTTSSSSSSSCDPDLAASSPHLPFPPLPPSSPTHSPLPSVSPFLSFPVGPRASTTAWATSLVHDTTTAATTTTKLTNQETTSTWTRASGEGDSDSEEVDTTTELRRLGLVHRFLFWLL